MKCNTVCTTTMRVSPKSSLSQGSIIAKSQGQPYIAADGLSHLATPIQCLLYHPALVCQGRRFSSAAAVAGSMVISNVLQYYIGVHITRRSFPILHHLHNWEAENRAPSSIEFLHLHKIALDAQLFWQTLRVAIVTLVPPPLP